MNSLLDRRSLLRRGLVTLPLIGGGVTLIGRPAAAVPLADIAAAPLVDDPMQRARYAWTAFAAAMRDASVGSDGWLVRGGERFNSAGRLPAREAWLDAQRLDLIPMPDIPNGLMEQHGKLFQVHERIP